MVTLARRRPDLLPSLAVGVSGAVWGLFWIPLRDIEAAGVKGGWGSLGFFVVCVGLLLPFAALRWRRLYAGSLPLLLTGVTSGAAFALYATSLVFTEVVRAILLFYLTPVWGTVLGRLLLGERVTAARAAAIVLGLAGLAVILELEAGVPMPRNAGDWMALAAGLSWAYGSLRIYDDARTGVFESVFVFFACGLLVALALMWLPLEGHQMAPPASAFRSAGPALAVTSAVALPMMTAIIWGATALTPARVGLLLMGEVVVGVISAALLADEPYGARELAGSVLIIAAALIEVLQRPVAPR